MCTCGECVECEVCKEKGIIKNTTKRGEKKHLAWHKKKGEAHASASAANQDAGDEDEPDDDLGLEEESDDDEVDSGDELNAAAVDEEATCALCAVLFTVDEPCIQCAQCEQWFHLVCLEAVDNPITEEEVEEMGNWFCRDENCKMQEECYLDLVDVNAEASAAIENAQMSNEDKELKEEEEEKEEHKKKEAAEKKEAEEAMARMANIKIGEKRSSRVKRAPNNGKFYST